MMTIDIDGTLLNSDGEITDEVKSALQDATAKDVKIVLMTGRPRKGIAQFLSQIDIGESGNYAASFNGAVVENFKTGERMVSHGLNYDDLKGIYDLSIELKTPMHYLANDQVYTPNHNVSKYTMYESTSNNIPLTVVDIENVDQSIEFEKAMFVDEPDVLDQVVERVPDAFREKYNLVQSAPFFLEILNKEADKGHALLEMADYFGIKPEAVVAIGDGGNDVGMIKAAGLGIAMGNAMDGVKEVADVVTKTNNEDGVAYAIKKWVLS